ncbi:DUF5777 family beta-barrel protein [Mangrovibacterium marinum]|uniref:DUF5777 family beta-barrel protein n=1 Tax=Mangrovibacterium marinum TaxID=1639118 RepID=UPI002A18DEA3|nr:DUF5777 family beta-barrel protein [Mangrovibacterium marinum]
MKKKIIYILLSLLVCANVFAQDAEENVSVGPAFENGTLIDAQTSFIPDVKSLEFIIQHKFGPIDNGDADFDLFGIYAPGANIRLALNYVPARNVQIGMGITKSSDCVDFNGKWTILEQTENNKIPFFVTVYANTAITYESKDDLGSLMDYDNPSSRFDYRLSDRFSYFAQVFVGRKFTNALSVQGGVSFSHDNLVDAWHDHDRVALHLDGRLKFSGQSSFIFNFGAPLRIDKISEQHPDWTAANPPHPDWKGPYNPKPSLKFGVEISTFTHAFQIYVGNANAILPQFDMMNNYNKPFDGLAFGFTITRLWMY